MGSGPSVEKRAIYCRHEFEIPWGPNAIDDSWVELQLQDRSFWIELPFGFSRDPESPLKSEPARGTALVPDVRPISPTGLRQEALVIPWQYVFYRIEDLPEPKFVWVKLTNPFDAVAELMLGNFGDDIREPRAELTLVAANGRERVGTCVGLSKDKGTWHTQRYRFQSAPGLSQEGRHWGAFRLTIGNLTRTLTIPSSLYNYADGHANLDNFPEGVVVLDRESAWARPR